MPPPQMSPACLKHSRRRPPALHSFPDGTDSANSGMFAKRVFEEQPSLLAFHKRLRACYFFDGTSAHFEFQTTFGAKDAKVVSEK
jgi:hypothetical protein